MPNIMKIEMCFNKIKTGLDAFSCFPNLRFLKLRGNRISEIHEVAKLSNVQLLQSLDLQQNPIFHIENYRKEVFYVLE